MNLTNLYTENYDWGSIITVASEGEMGRNWAVVLHDEAQEQCDILLQSRKEDTVFNFTDEQGKRFKVSLAQEQNEGKPENDLLVFSGYHNFAVTRSQMEKAFGERA